MNRTKGELIGKWRVYLGLSQQEVCDKIGVTSKSLSNWETNARNPKDSSLRRFAETFNIHYQDFLAGPEEYERRRRERDTETARAIIPLDTSRMSFVFLLSDIGRTIDARTRSVGFTLQHQLERNPCLWFNVVVDEKGHAFPHKQIVPVSKELNPIQGDYVLVWKQPGGSRFIKWSGKDTRHAYDSVHGVAVSKV